MALRLNVGAGDVKIDGFTPVDRKFGDEAYPLKYGDGEADEIRACHILEHFDFKQVPQVLSDWVRVLKEGGRMRLAVPDVDKIAAMSDDPRRLLYLMGGQTDDNDYHKSAFTEDVLRGLMERAGLANIQRWETDGLDTSCHRCSLNLEGVKVADAQPSTVDIKIAAVCSVPRYGSLAARGIIEHALRPFGLGLETFQGVFWGQCMQRAFEQYVEQGIDWILTVDFDSLFTKHHLDRMIGWFGQNQHIDALAPMQCRRGRKYPLCTVKGSTQQEIDGNPFKVDTAHFGMTLIRVSSLLDIPKPWFASRPDEHGEWGDHRLDDDIWFWHQWREHGKTVYVAPDVRIGHLEEMASVYDENFEPKHIYIPEWREENDV